MRTVITRWAARAAMVLALSASACVPSAQSAGAGAAKGAVPAGTKSALDTLEDPTTRARIAAVVATPEVQRAIDELAAGVSRGALEGLTSDEAKARIGELVAGVARAVDAALDQALSPRRQQAAEQFAAAVTASMMRSAAGEIPQSLAPALRKAMVEQLTPGMAESLRSPELKAALAEVSNDVARSAVIGSNNALAELEDAKKHRRGGEPLGSIGSFFSTRTWLLAALVTLVVLAIPIAWLLRDRRIARYREEQARLRTERATAVLAAIEASRERGASADLIALVRRHLLGEDLELPAEAPPEHGGPPRPQHA